MLTKFNDTNDMNAIASDAINSCIKDGYRIDAKESVIDREKDKDCTFKAVLKKDVDGIECKTVITLTDNGDDHNKSCTYHKVETIGDTKWSEKTRTYKSSTASGCKKKCCCDEDDNWLESHRKRMKRISDKYGFNWDWFGDSFDDRFNRLADVIKSPTDTTNSDKKDTKWKCNCPSAYQRLDDYVKLNDSKDSDVKIKFTTSNGNEVDVKDMRDQNVKVECANDHIKVDAKDSVDDIYNKIVNRKKNLEEAVNKARAKDIEEPKTSTEDDLEDSLIKLVRYIFGK